MDVTSRVVILITGRGPYPCLRRIGPPLPRSHGYLSQQHAYALEALARPRAMRSFLARALWVRAGAVRARGQAVEVTEAITLARESKEVPLLRSILGLAGSPEAAEVTDAIACSIPDLKLREKFLSASRV